MITYRKWYKTMIYQKVVIIGDTPRPYIKEVACDGWYLFGKLPLYVRENV